MTPDPAGYFVIYPDRARRLLNVEHYTTDDVLDGVIEGPTPAHCYIAAIEAGIVTRLDHAPTWGESWLTPKRTREGRHVRPRRRRRTIREVRMRRQKARQRERLIPARVVTTTNGISLHATRGLGLLPIRLGGLRDRSARGAPRSLRTGAIQPWRCGEGG
jgi:hypothetical protein